MGFHSNKLVKKVRVEKRINDIVNRLNKTKEELYPDLAAERETYDKGIRAARKVEVQVCLLAMQAVTRAAHMYVCLHIFSLHLMHELVVHADAFHTCSVWVLMRGLSAQTAMYWNER